MCGCCKEQGYVCPDCERRIKADAIYAGRGILSDHYGEWRVRIVLPLPQRVEPAPRS